MQLSPCSKTAALVQVLFLNTAERKTALYTALIFCPMVPGIEWTCNIFKQFFDAFSLQKTQLNHTTISHSCNLLHFATTLAGYLNSISCGRVSRRLEIL